MIHPERIKIVRKGAVRGRFVLYWMQQSQRADWNHALEYAVREADEAGLPVAVVFVLTEDFPEAEDLHYRFLLQGLADTARSLRERGIAFILFRGDIVGKVVEASRDAALLVFDRGYQRFQRQWRDAITEKVPCPVVMVETDVVVPVEKASGKEEYSAATLRPKIQRLLPFFLTPLEMRGPEKSSLHLEAEVGSESWTVFQGTHLRKPAPHSPFFSGGAAEAERRLVSFIENRLDTYDEVRSDPSKDGLSHLSPYLHFGQISPLDIALRVLETGSPGTERFLEELIIRRELSMNFVWYNPQYDQYDALPPWARDTLQAHMHERKEHLYTLEDFESACTHDIYWNAAMKEMLLTGKMHGYMRMYWGKKILEWSRTPREGYEILLRLNNRYLLDGRDPNGYAGAAWCFGKHDRPWPQRKVFGSVRSMMESGLKRKFPIDLYIKNVEAMTGGTLKKE